MPVTAIYCCFFSCYLQLIGESPLLWGDFLKTATNLRIKP